MMRSPEKNPAGSRNIEHSLQSGIDLKFTHNKNRILPNQDTVAVLFNRMHDDLRGFVGT